MYPSVYDISGFCAREDGTLLHFVPPKGEGERRAVLAALGARENGLRGWQMLCQVGDHSGIVSQPEPLCTDRCSQRSAQLAMVQSG